MLHELYSPIITRKWPLKMVFSIDKVVNTSEEIPNTDMENRIDRKDDESLYQPKIHSEKEK